jgi:hypothetical protein
LKKKSARQDKTNKTRQKARQDNIKNKTRHNKTRPEKARQEDKTTQDETDHTIQDKTARQGQKTQDKTAQYKTCGVFVLVVESCKRFDFITSGSFFILVSPCGCSVLKFLPLSLQALSCGFRDFENMRRSAAPSQKLSTGGASLTAQELCSQVRQLPKIGMFFRDLLVCL